MVGDDVRSLVKNTSHAKADQVRGIVAGKLEPTALKYQLTTINC
jgi:hypothetical protein